MKPWDKAKKSKGDKVTINLQYIFDLSDQDEIQQAINVYHLVDYIRYRPSGVVIKAENEHKFVLNIENYDPDWAPYPGWSTE